MEFPAAWFDHTVQYAMCKRKKNPANANTLSCELCKIFNLGADSLESHLNGKRHRTKAEQAKVAQRNKAWETAEEREIREPSVPAAAAAAEVSKPEGDLADVREDVAFGYPPSWGPNPHGRLPNPPSCHDGYRGKPRSRRHRGRDDDDHSRRARYRDSRDDRGSLGSSRRYERSRRRDSYSDSGSREYRRRDQEYGRRRSGERYEERSEYREAGRHRGQKRGRPELSEYTRYTLRGRREGSTEDDSSDDAYSHRNVARDYRHLIERHHDRRRSVSVERDASGGYSSDRRTRLRRRSPERLDGMDHSEERETRRKRTRDRGNDSSRESLRDQGDDDKRRRVERHQAVSRVHQCQTGSGEQSEKLSPPSPVLIVLE